MLCIKLQPALGIQSLSALDHLTNCIPKCHSKTLIIGLVRVLTNQIQDAEEGAPQATGGLCLGAFEGPVTSSEGQAAVDRILSMRSMKVRGGTINIEGGPLEKHGERPLHWTGYSCGLLVRAFVAPRCACLYPSCHCFLWSEGLNFSQVSWHQTSFPLCFTSSLSSPCMSLWYNSKPLWARIQWTQPNRKLACSLFIWNHEAEIVGHLFSLLHWAGTELKLNYPNGAFQHGMI